MLPESVPQLIGAIAGVIMSLLVEIPVVKGWFDGLSISAKRIVMSALLILAAALTYAFTCLGWLAFVFPNIALTCDEPGLAILVSALFSALFANQSTYLLFFKSPKAEEAKPTATGTHYHPEG